MELPQTQNADFVVNLGDMIDYADFQKDYYDCIVAPQRDFAKNKPVYHIRGNHETYGYSPLSFFEVFPHHSGKSYYAFKYGKVFFIALDGGDDRPFPEMVNLAKEENLWLRELVKSDDFRNAEARIILCHMPVTMPNERHTKRMQMILQDVFIGANPMAKADLYLAGPTHIASISQANEEQALIFGSNKQSMPVIKMPFPVICNGGPFKDGIEYSMLHVEKQADSIKINIVLEDGTVLANYEIKLQE